MCRKSIKFKNMKKSSFIALTVGSCLIYGVLGILIHFLEIEYERFGDIPVVSKEVMRLTSLLKLFSGLAVIVGGIYFTVIIILLFSIKQEVRLQITANQAQAVNLSLCTFYFPIMNAVYVFFPDLNTGFLSWLFGGIICMIILSSCMPRPFNSIVWIINLLHDEENIIT